MSLFVLTTPVAFIIFNRPDVTARVFAEIEKLRPSKLFIIADGPRLGRLDDIDKCAAARAIVEMVNWECEIFRNYSDINLGCRGRVSSGISWVFEQVEEAIILEDDCIPHPSFFRYCQELLDRYRDDSHIFTISGNNFQLSNEKRATYDYYFSRYMYCWGWATWRRAWKHYDNKMTVWPEINKDDWLYDVLGDRRLVNYWSKVFQRTYENQIDTWDYRFLFCIWMNHGLNVYPSINLVKNIGFGDDATHTKDAGDNLGPITEMLFPLRHPPFIIQDNRNDRFVEKTAYGISCSITKFVHKLSQRLTKFMI